MPIDTYWNFLWNSTEKVYTFPNCADAMVWSICNQHVQVACVVCQDIMSRYLYTLFQKHH